MPREKEGSKSPLGLPLSNTPFAGAPHHHGNQDRVHFPTDSRMMLQSAAVAADSSGPPSAASSGPPTAENSGVYQSQPTPTVGTRIGSFLGPAPAEPMVQPNRGQPSQRKFSPLRASNKIRNSAAFTSDSIIVADGTQPTPMIDLTAPLEVMSAATLEVRRSLLVEELERVDYALESRRRQQRYELVAREQGVAAPGHHPVTVNTSRHNSPTRRGTSPPMQNNVRHVVSSTPPSILTEAPVFTTPMTSPTTPQNASSSNGGGGAVGAMTERRRAIASDLRAQALSLMTATSKNRLTQGGGHVEAAPAQPSSRSYSPVVAHPHLVSSAGGGVMDSKLTLVSSASDFHLVQSPRAGGATTPVGSTGGIRSHPHAAAVPSGPKIGAVTGGGANPVVMEELYRLRMQRESTGGRTGGQ